MIEKEVPGERLTNPDENYCICHSGKSYGKDCNIVVPSPCLKAFEHRKGLELLDLFDVDPLSELQDTDHLFIKCFNMLPQIYETRQFTRWCQSIGHIGESQKCPEDV